ncbi:MAG: hypothetical protein HY904_09300 [Deltaproteobacteria bacterium]|nr:hypothetical protein [Deltaproteobacteria bacterium]
MNEELLTMNPPHPSSAPPDPRELLADLAHDLGKYLRMPVAFLPAAASDDEVRDAARRALLETRVTPTGTRGARALWEAFLAEGGDALRGREGFDELERAVARALAWETRVRDGGSALERPALVADFSAVSAAIRALSQRLD